MAHKFQFLKFNFRRKLYWFDSRCSWVIHGQAGVLSGVDNLPQASDNPPSQPPSGIMLKAVFLKCSLQRGVDYVLNFYLIKSCSILLKLSGINK